MGLREMPDCEDARRLSIAQDINQAMAAGYRLRLASSMGQSFDRTHAMSSKTAGDKSLVLRTKLATIHILNAVGRRYPHAALVAERSMKKAWWTLTGTRGGDRQSRLFSPFVTLNAPRAAYERGEAAASSGREEHGAASAAGSFERHPAGAPLISVVIPCFNYGSFVGEAVASVLAQTYKDLEIILVDGGSTDGTTPDVVRSLEAPNVKVFLRETAHRVGSNRNFGIERARGRYVCCLDADDRLHPTYLEKAVFLLEQYSFDVVSTSIQLFGQEGSQHAVLENVDLQALLQDNEIATCGVFRRSLWGAIGGYRDHGAGEAIDHVHEDWEFWVRLAAIGARIVNIRNEYLFQYRVHGSTSLSRRTDVRSMAEQRQAIISANADRLTEDAIRYPVGRRAEEAVCPDSLAALLRNVPDPDDRCLIVMMPWMVLGGAERLLSVVLADLKARGWRIVIVTTMEPHAADGDTSDWFSFTSEIFNLPTYLPDTSRWAPFLEYLFASRAAGKLLVAGSAFGYESLRHLKSRFPGLKVYDLLFNTVGHTGNNRRNARHIDRHIVENREVRDWLVHHGELTERISLVPSGVVVPPLDPMTRRDARALLGIDGDDFVVGFSGRWSPEKNPLGFVDIAAELLKDPGIRFVMTGVGQMKEDVARRLNKIIGSTDRFSLLYDLDDVSHVMPAYDVLVVPSKLDGRPQVVLEALALGVPVIASGIGGLPELVRHRSHGAICDPDRIDTFVSEIKRLRASSAELARYKEAARAFAISELDASDMVKRFEAALAA